jgi:FtsZ-binding cell division protein ZapB
VSEGIIVAIISLLAVPISLTIGWIVNRRRNLGDVYAALTESSQSAVELMQMTMETLSKELKDATDEIVLLKREISELRHQNLLLLQENHALHAKIDSLVKIVDTGEIPLQGDSVSDPAS